MIFGFSGSASPDCGEQDSVSVLKDLLQGAWINHCYRLLVLLLYMIPLPSRYSFLINISSHLEIVETQAALSINPEIINNLDIEIL